MRLARMCVFCERLCEMTMACSPWHRSILVSSTRHPATDRSWRNCLCSRSLKRGWHVIPRSPEKKTESKHIVEAQLKGKAMEATDLCPWSFDAASIVSPHASKVCPLIFLSWRFSVLFFLLFFWRHHCERFSLLPLLPNIWIHTGRCAA